MSKKAAIIIVNWNGKKFLKDCLSSVFKQTYKNFEVYFVDNGSVDDSVKYVKNNFSKVKIIQLDKNYGFAEGNNIGIRKALKDINVNYIIPLNNDTEVKKEFLSRLIKCAEQDKKIGSVAPKIIFFDNKKLIDSVGILVHQDGSGVNRGFKEFDEGQYDKIEEIFGVCAGATLYKRDMLEDIKIDDDYFDKSFFAYYEDLDLAWRARLMGWKSMSCPNAIVYHIHSATGKSYSPFKSYYVNRNRFFVIIKNFPKTFLIKNIILTPLRYLRLIDSIIKKKGPSYKLKENTNSIQPVIIVLKGWSSVLMNLPSILIKRRNIQKNKVVTDKQIKKWFEKYGAKMEDMIYK
jgi:hypothetical protein